MSEKRYYLHGDLRQEDGTVYCSRCDEFHQYGTAAKGCTPSSRSTETDYQRFYREQEAFYAIKAGKGTTLFGGKLKGYFRPQGAKNMLA